MIERSKKTRFKFHGPGMLVLLMVLLSMKGSHAQDGAKTRSASDASLALAIRMACARS